MIQKVDTLKNTVISSWSAVLHKTDVSYALNSQHTNGFRASLIQRLDCLYCTLIDSCNLRFVLWW